MTKKKETKKEVKKIGVISSLGYLFGALFFLSGISNLILQDYSGLYLIIAGIIIFPSTNNLLKNKFNISLSRTLRIILAIILMFIAGASNINDVQKQDSNNFEINQNTNNNEQIQTVQLSTIDTLSIKNFDYKDAIRYPEKYEGQYLFFEGEVIQIQSSLGRTYARVDINNEEFNFEGEVIWVEYTGARLAEGDKLIGFLELDGVETYEAVLGNEITIPKGNFVYIHNYDSSESFNFRDNLIVDIDVKNLRFEKALEENNIEKNSNSEEYKFITNLSNSDVFIGVVGLGFENKETWGKLQSIVLYVEPKKDLIDLGMFIQIGDETQKRSEYSSKLFQVVDYISENKEGTIITIENLDIGVPTIENEKEILLSLSDSSYYFTSAGANTKFNYNFNELN